MLWAPLRACAEFWVASGRTEADEMLQPLRLPTVKLQFLHSQHTLLSWAAINRAMLRGKRNKRKTRPLDDIERLKMIALLRCGEGGQAACQGHSHTPPAAHSLRLEVGSSRLAAARGPLWWRPQATWGYKEKTTVEQSLGWEGQQPGFSRDST